MIAIPHKTTMSSIEITTGNNAICDAVIIPSAPHGIYSNVL